MHETRQDNTRPVGRPHRIFAAVVVGAALASSVALATVFAAQEPPRPTTIFGYEPGELVSYELGPPDSLAPGESAAWTMRLESFEYDGAETLAVFSFTHDRFERLAGSYARNDIISVTVEGFLRTNMAGFPLYVEYQQRFVFEGDEMANAGRRTLEFTYDPERRRYEKIIKVGTNNWDFRFGIPNQRHLDLDVPRGLYLYMPTALGCLGDTRNFCVEIEPALANPGFLSFTIGALEEMEKSEREFLFLMPVSLSQSPFQRVMGGPWLSRERDRMTSIERYFEFVKLKLGASSEVEIGPRTMHAWEVDMCCGIKQAWVEPSGRVLRVDLESTLSNPDDRWIRFIHPFEEFISPNDDPELRCCD